MAIRYAVANGNWSSTSTWNGGTLPTSADDVYANNFTVTIDQNVTVLSVRTETTTGVTAGGNFTLNSGITLTADVYAGAVASTSCVTFNSVSPASATITGNIYGTTQGTTTSGINAVLNNTSGTLTINGNVTAGSSTSSSSTRLGVRNNSVGTININGDIIGTRLTTSGNHNAVSSAGGTINIVGNILSGRAQYGSAVIATGGTINVTGNVAIDSANNFSQTYGIEVLNTNVTASGVFTYAGASGAQCVYCSNSGTAQLSGSYVSTGTGGGGLLNLATSTNGIVTMNLTNGTTANSGSAVIFHSSSGSLVVNGSITRTGPGYMIRTTGSGAQSVTINGDVSTSGGVQHVILHERLGGTLTLNGNCFAPTFGSGNQCGIFSNQSNTIIVNGNVTGGSFSGVQNAGVYLSVSGATCTINGSAIGGSGTLANGVYLVSGCTATIRRAVGNAYGSGSVGLVSTPGVAGAQGSTVNVQEFEFGLRGQSPISNDCRIQLTANSVAVFRDSSGNQVTLVNPSSVVTPPAVTDVRSGVVYNAGNLTGTCAVPAASSVAAGVAVDNTVGTAVLTQANVWSYSLASASGTAGSVGEKLKKAATAADIIALG